VVARMLNNAHFMRGAFILFAFWAGVLLSAGCEGICNPPPPPRGSFRISEGTHVGTIRMDEGRERAQILTYIDREQFLAEVPDIRGAQVEVEGIIVQGQHMIK